MRRGCKCSSALQGMTAFRKKRCATGTGASPASVRTLVRRGLVECTEQQVYRRVPVDVQPAGPIRLEGEQRQAYDRLRQLCRTPRRRWLCCKG